MGTEWEMKFRATASQQLRIAQAYHTCQWTRWDMATVYYDTPDGQLSRRRCTLRLRQENDTCVCTLKTPGIGLSRGDWEVKAASIEAGVDMLCKLEGPSEILAQRNGPLVPVCGAEFTRQACGMEIPGGKIELALDIGWLTGGGNRQSLREIEVERKSGSEDAAAAFARALAEAYDLCPEPLSKFARARILAKGE